TITLSKSDISDFSDADYATAAEGDLAVSAVQPGDNISDLTNDAGYITSSSVVTDHGALTGLGDDDHTQYYNQSRGDARYTQLSNNLSDLASASTARTNLGLGTAAVANVTTSDTDTTINRVWRTNDLVKTTSTQDTTTGSMVRSGDYGLSTLVQVSNIDYNANLPGLSAYYVNSIY